MATTATDRATIGATTSPRATAAAGATTPAPAAPRPSPRTPLVLHASAGFKVYLRGLAAHLDLRQCDVVARGLALLARAENYPPPPPRLGSLPGQTSPDGGRP
jgi:hypothetical protein